MANRFLVPCNCGKSIPIETSQAGQIVSCSCGRQVTVPSLRAIRQLPVAADQPTVKRPRTWNPSQGALFAVGAVLIMGGLVAALHGYSVYSQISIVEPSQEEHQAALAAIDQMSVDQLFEAWHFAKDHPLEPAETSFFAIARNVAREKLQTCYAGIVVATIGLVLVAAAVLIRRK